jgi:hypothetical protein
MNVRITLADGVSPKLASVMKTFTGAGLTALHRAAGRGIQEKTRDHISKLKRKPDSLASRYNLPASGHYGQAAEKVAADSALSADVSGATLTINSVGFSRAFRGLVIVPKTAKFLAIPINAISAGHRAAELWERMKLFIPKGSHVIKANIGGVITPMYILCKSVKQKQDRTLLPSDAEFQEAATKGALSYLGLALKKGGN